MALLRWSQLTRGERVALPVLLGAALVLIGCGIFDVLSLAVTLPAVLVLSVAFGYLRLRDMRRHADRINM